MSDSNKNANEDDNAELVAATIKKYCSRPDDVPVEKETNISLDIEGREQSYMLVRLSDEQYFQLSKNSIAIFDDYAHLMHLSMDKELIFSSFAKMYAALRWRFGECGRCYDDWKGSFSYPFLIYFKKGDEEFEYLMNLFNIRSSIEFRLSKLVPTGDERINKRILHNPFEDFPRDEINYVINYLVGFLTGFFEAVNKHTACEPFFGTGDSNLIVFGYKDGKYFDDQYEDEEQFRQAIQELVKNNIPKINK